jgi:hypothetical protein
LSDECIEYVKSGEKSKNGPRKRFGKNIQFFFQPSKPSFPDTSFLLDISAAMGSEVLRDFSMKYDDVAALISTKEDIKKNCSKSNGVGKY